MVAEGSGDVVIHVGDHMARDVVTMLWSLTCTPQGATTNLGNATGIAKVSNLFDHRMLVSAARGIDLLLRLHRLPARWTSCSRGLRDGVVEVART